MTVLVLDAGALIAIDRGDRELVALLKREHRAGRTPVTHGGVVGQVWRGGSRQAALAAALKGIRVAPIDGELGRRAGALLARTRGRDVLDAALALLASDDDEIFTSDPDDLRVLCEAAGIAADVIPI